MEGYIQKLGGVKRYVQFLEISEDHRDGSTDHFSAKALVK